MAQRPIAQSQLDVLQGSQIADVYRQSASKASAESRTSTTTTTADSELDSVFTCEANTLYAIKAVLFVTDGFSSGGLRVSLRANSGSTVAGIVHRPVIGAGMDFSVLAKAQTPVAAFVIGSTSAVVVIEAVLEQGSTPGTLEFFWAQNVSDGTPTQLLAGSNIAISKLD